MLPQVTESTNINDVADPRRVARYWWKVPHAGVRNRTRYPISAPASPVWFLCIAIG